jgi:hypothetical protein
LPAVAAGLHWIRAADCHPAAQDAAAAQSEATREEDAAKLSECIHKAAQVAEVQLDGIMARLERIEQKIDQL